MRKEPMPATAGSKVPVLEFVIPVPVHTPPTLSAVSVTGGLLIHKGGTAVITGFAPPLGVTSTTTDMVIGDKQDDKGVPLAVYVVVDGGLAVTLVPVVADKPVEGVIGNCR
jgi:hypothetical protein